MAIDPRQTWVDSINKIAPAGDAPTPIKKLSDATHAATTGKAQLTGIMGPVSFTFEKAIFYAGLVSLTATQVPQVGVTQFVNAWVQAVQASKMVVGSGASIGAPTPPTTFSVVQATTLDPPSLATAKQFMEAELLSAGFNPVSDSNDGLVGPAMWQAFQMLTYTIVGLDSTPSGSGGPLPLTAPANKLM